MFKVNEKFLKKFGFTFTPNFCVIRKREGFTQHLQNFIYTLRQGKLFTISSSYSLGFRSQGAGFTLIELLVVISIIGILSSFAVVQLNDARTKARNALRKGDMAQIRTALGIYYDNNLGYPVCSTSWTGDPSDNFGTDDIDASTECFDGKEGTTPDSLKKALTTGPRPLMQSIPKDPKNINNDHALDNTYRYLSDPSGSEYVIVYTIEGEGGGDELMRGW